MARKRTNKTTTIDCELRPRALDKPLAEAGMQLGKDIKLESFELLLPFGSFRIYAPRELVAQLQAGVETQTVGFSWSFTAEAT